MRQFFTSLKTEFHQSRNLIFVVFIFFMVATLSFFATSQTDQSSAASLDSFKAGNIMSDAVMGNYNSMSVDDIQRFLTSKNPCNNTDYDQYLASSRAYPNVTWHWSGEPYNGHFVCISEERFGEGTTIGSGQTAAEIIYGAAQEYKINPQVLIVLLEKEQGLITDTLPHSGQYRAATGYGCPDTAACDSKYYGLKNQLYNAAWLFRYTLDNGYYAYPEQTRGVYVAYNPSASCGRSEVYIENRATAALYRYTPYQPNAAALAAGSGYGDGCSAYGNRNFYLYFTSWFGSTQAAVKGDLTVVPDGEYNLALASTTDLSLGLSGSNAELTPTDPKNTRQRWNIQRDASTGYYTITNVASGRPLAVADTKAASGTNVQTTYSTSSCSSKWRIYRSPSNNFIIESTCASGLVLGSFNNQHTLGTNISIEVAQQGAAAQEWTLWIGQQVQNGTYNILVKNDNTKAVDISGGIDRNGTNIQLWEVNHEWPQNWKITYNAATDSYTIANTASGRLLDLASANTNKGTNVQLWEATNSCAQRWKILPTGSGSYTVLSACSLDRALDLVDGRAVNQNNVRLWEVNNADAEKWQIVEAQQIPNGTYNILVKNDNTKAVDISGGIDRNGTNIQLWEVNHEWPQNWKITYFPDKGYYSVINPSSNKYLEVANGNMTKGTNVQLWEATNSCAQYWYIIKTTDGYYNFKSACSRNFALDLVDGRAVNQNNVRLWEVNNADAEKWQIVEAEH